MSRTFHLARSCAPGEGNNYALTQQDDLELPPIQIGRFVEAVLPPQTYNQDETLFDYRDRIAQENAEDERGDKFQITDASSMFVPLIRADDFTSIVLNNHPKGDTLSPKRAMDQLRNARKQVSGALRTVMEQDRELAALKAETLAAARVDDPDFGMPMYGDLDSVMQGRWGERVVGVRPQARQVDSYTLGFSLQADTDTSTANSEVLDSIRTAGFARGLSRTKLTGSQIVDFVDLDVTLHDMAPDERPILPPPPKHIVVGPITMIDSGEELLY